MLWLDIHINFLKIWIIQLYLICKVWIYVVFFPYLKSVPLTNRWVVFLFCFLLCFLSLREYKGKKKCSTIFVSTTLGQIITETKNFLERFVSENFIIINWNLFERFCQIGEHFSLHDLLWEPLHSFGNLGYDLSCLDICHFTQETVAWMIPLKRCHEPLQKEPYFPMSYIQKQIHQHQMKLNF